MNWLKKAYEEALKLTKLEKNWDDENGTPISIDLVEKFYKKLQSLKNLSVLNDFFVVPLHGGKAFQIEWRYKKIIKTTI